MSGLKEKGDALRQFAKDNNLPIVDLSSKDKMCDDHAYLGKEECPECESNDAAAFPDPQPALSPEGSEQLQEFMEQTPVVPLTPQEQAQALRDYVASMQRTQGHTNAELREIIETIHRRVILVINYSGADATVIKSIKTAVKDIVIDELERYKDE